MRAARGSRDPHTAAIVEHAPEAIVSIDARGCIVDWNLRAQSAVGWSAEEARGRSFAELLIPASQVEAYARAHGRANAVRGGAEAPWTELLLARRDQAHVAVELAMVPLPGVEPPEIAAFARAARAARNTDEMLRLAVDASPVGMVMTDDAGRIRLANARIEEWFGWHRDELIGHTIEMLVPERLRAQHLRERTGYERAPLQRPMGIDRLLSAVRKDGTEFTVEIALSPVRGDAGGGVLALIVDTSEQRRMAAVHEQTRRELDRANLELDQFTYIASHDLRAPLRAISNLGAWIVEDLGTEAPPAVAAHVERMRARIARMERLIDGLLEFARASRPLGAMARVDTRELIEDAIALLAPRDGIETVLEPGLPSFPLPPVRFAQVIRNLLDNAYKHHDRPQGRVVVGCRERAAHYEFFVSDDGPGIPSEHRERIFQPFQTLKSRDEVEGSGLGLALVKKIVESHGGAIWLDASDGSGERGANFRFTWPKTIDDTESSA